MGILAGVSPQRNTHKCTTAVTDEYGNAQRHHRKRKDSGVCGVAVRAKVACVGDENLIYNVVERAHQQRNDARQGILPHEFPNALGAQELICFFHKCTPFDRKCTVRSRSLCIQKAAQLRNRIYALCHSLRIHYNPLSRELQRKF